MIMEMAGVSISDAIKDLGVSQYGYDTLTFLISDMQEFEYFYTHYWKGIRTQFFTINRYRIDIMGKSFITLSQFLSECSKNLKQSLESLFCHPITDEELSLVRDKVFKGEITFKQLYKKHQEEPELHLLRLIL